MTAWTRRQSHVSIEEAISGVLVMLDRAAGPHEAECLRVALDLLRSAQSYRDTQKTTEEAEDHESHPDAPHHPHLDGYS